MVAGGLLSAMILTPTFSLFDKTEAAKLLPAKDAEAAVRRIGGPIEADGSNLTEAEYDRRDVEARRRHPRRTYVLYIGAGAVATGGIISLFQSLPLILGGVAGSVSGRSGGASDVPSLEGIEPGTAEDRPRPARLSFVDRRLDRPGGRHRQRPTLIDTDILRATRRRGASSSSFGFLFVTVSSRLTGEIGSSSNPISGMTVATLLLTCLVFVSVGWRRSRVYRLAALSIAGIVCIASVQRRDDLAGPQDRLPRRRDAPGSSRSPSSSGRLTSAIVIGFTLLVLNDAGTVYTTSKAEYLPTENAQAEPEFELAKDGTPKVVDGPDGKPYQASGGSRTAERKVGDVVKSYRDPASTSSTTPCKPAYYVDPAINGRVEQRDRHRHRGYVKYAAPKATLDGPDHRRDHEAARSPGAKVILGVFIADRPATGRRPGPGVRRRRLPPAVDLDADLPRSGVDPRRGRTA